jgi:sirohydrochlorin cobaltochelatase
MEAVLFVGHGSRDPEGNKELLLFIRHVAEQLRQIPIRQTAFLELARPSVPEGIRSCVTRGATSITLVPVMLFTAGHAKSDIPHEIAEARINFPHVTFRCARPVGVDPAVIDILRARASAVGMPAPAVPDRDPDLAVLIVGRGSSDPDANSDLFKISRLFWESYGAHWVETSFIGITEPRLEEGMERCIRLGAKRILVLPYFLFTGILVKRMRRILDAIKQENRNLDIRMGAHFGDHERLAAIVLHRTLEAIQDGKSAARDTELQRENA